MKDGTKIRIKDMADPHLENTIKMLERKARAVARSVPFPMFQGEMAQFYAEREYDILQENPLSILEGSIYDDLVEEKERRDDKRISNSNV